MPSRVLRLARRALAWLALPSDVPCRPVPSIRSRRRALTVRPRLCRRACQSLARARLARSVRHQHDDPLRTHSTHLAWPRLCTRLDETVAAQQPATARQRVRRICPAASCTRLCKPALPDLGRLPWTNPPPSRRATLHCAEGGIPTRPPSGPPPPPTIQIPASHPTTQHCPATGRPPSVSRSLPNTDRPRDYPSYLEHAPNPADSPSAYRAPRHAKTRQRFPRLRTPSDSPAHGLTTRARPCDLPTRSAHPTHLTHPSQMTRLAELPPRPTPLTGPCHPTRLHPANPTTHPSLTGPPTCHRRPPVPVHPARHATAHPFFPAPATCQNPAARLPRHATPLSCRPHRHANPSVPPRLARQSSPAPPFLHD